MNEEKLTQLEDIKKKIIALGFSKEAIAEVNEAIKKCKEEK